MTKRDTVFPILLVAACLSGPAFSATPPAKAVSPVDRNAADEAAFRRIDTNGDRMLSFEEFKSELAARRQRAAITRLQQQFDRMDGNRSGALEPVEFGALPLIQRAGAEAPAFAEIDGNRDQRIDFKEYVAMVGRLVPVSKAGGQP